jgi:CRISPR-associated protein Cas1
VTAVERFSRAVPAAQIVQRTCENCGSTFPLARKTQGRFCSRACYQQWWTATKQQSASRKGADRLAQLRDQGSDPRKSEHATWKRQMSHRNIALSAPPQDADEDDVFWSARGAYWEDAVAAPKVTSPWRRDRMPLVLAGHGAQLRIDAGTLLVRNGLTHHPQAREEFRFFPGDPTLPSRLVLVDTDGFITMGAIEWLALQDVPVLLLSWDGANRSLLPAGGSRADPELLQAQVRALSDGTGLRLATDLIVRKVDGSAAALAGLPDSPLVSQARARLADIRAELFASPPTDVDALRLVEARAAAQYFAAWRDLPLRWREVRRRPIPAEWRRMPIRGSLLLVSNRHATHPVNALLNYAYSVLESQVHAALLVAGLEPSLGYLHANRPGRAALVYDVMEPFRPMIDAELLRFIRSHTFSAGDVFLTQRGVCRLHPQLAKAASQLTVDDAAVRARVDLAVSTLIGAARATYA